MNCYAVLLKNCCVILVLVLPVQFSVIDSVFLAFFFAKFCFSIDKGFALCYNLLENKEEPPVLTVPPVACPVNNNLLVVFSERSLRGSFFISLEVRNHSKRTIDQ